MTSFRKDTDPDLTLAETSLILPAFSETDSSAKPFVYMQVGFTIRFGLLVCLTAFLSSCATVKNSRLQSRIDNSNCNQENDYHYTNQDIPKPVYELQLDSALTSRLSLKDINIANAIGVLNLLSDYVGKIEEVKGNHSLQNQIGLIEIRQEINHRIDLASLEISSVTAELDCEEERIDQIVSYLKDKEKKKETHLTVGSIILGSLSAIVTGILISKKNESNVSDYIGAGVGIADATLGVLILTNQQTIKIQHPRNVLREIWLGTETSTVYPPSIWYYLNYTDLKTSNNISLREQLIKNWESFGQINSKTKDSGNQPIDIYFGDGGKYTSDELGNRANMYDQIESSIKLMKQDLRNLTLSIGNVR